MMMIMILRNYVCKYWSYDFIFAHSVQSFLYIFDVDNIFLQKSVELKGSQALQSLGLPTKR